MGHLLAKLKKSEQCTIPPPLLSFGLDSVGTGWFETLGLSGLNLINVVVELSCLVKFHGDLVYCSVDVCIFCLYLFATTCSIVWVPRTIGFVILFV